MNTHQMKLTTGPFEKISLGQKIIESRLFDEKRRKINVGDCIVFTSNDDSAKKIGVEVRALYRYGSFEELFSDFPPEYFGGATQQELNEGIRRYYSPEDEGRYGVVGIKIELIKK